MVLIDDFKPHRLLGNGTAQSIASVFWPRPVVRAARSERALVPIGHDGHLSIVQDIPQAWKPGDRIVLLVHGLTGSEESAHLVRLSQLFIQQGVMAVRMNMRGCGPGEGLARGIYHSGRSEDTRSVLEWIALRYPNSLITQIGISLGGNATLKMAGELGSKHPDYLEGVVAVAAPIDLKSASRRIGEAQNRLFDFYFAKHLMRHVDRQSLRFPDKIPSIPNNLRVGKVSLARFDDLYVAPVSGFRNGLDYYEKCSAIQFLGSIRCRHLLLASEDDPIIPIDRYLSLRKESNCDLVITKKGGHAAYISNQLDAKYGRFWMDKLVVQWVLKSP